MYGVSQVLDYTRERNVPIPLEFTEANNYMERIETLEADLEETILNTKQAYFSETFEEILYASDYDLDTIEEEVE